MTAYADATGALLSVNTYDDWGIPAAGNIGRFQYTGQAWIPELGMYYYKARYYVPALGRFLQTDPVGYKDQFNLYAYVANDPVNGKDPDGMLALPGDGCGGEKGQVSSSCAGLQGVPENAGPSAGGGPAGSANLKKVGWVVELLKAGERKLRKLESESAAREARRRGENVRMTNRQAAGRVERGAAADPSDVMRHSGHTLKDGSKGSPHFQTEGRTGHTFYGVGAAILSGLGTAMDYFDQATDPFNDSGLSTCQDAGKCRFDQPIENPQ